MGRYSTMAIDALRARDSIEGLEFYVTKSDNRGPELHCRIWDFGMLSKDHAEAIAHSLNLALKPIIERESAAFKEAAMRSLELEGKKP